MTVQPTSAMAYEQIKSEGLLTRSRMAAYEKLFELGPATVNEMLEGFPEAQRKANADNFHSRIGELVESGVAVVVRVRPCKINGRMVSEYEATANLPSKAKRVSKKPSKKEMPHALSALRRVAQLRPEYTTKLAAHMREGNDGGEGMLWVLDRVVFTEEEHAALIKLGKWLAKTREKGDSNGQDDPTPTSSRALPSA